jgi:hypothetical protein
MTERELVLFVGGFLLLLAAVGWAAETIAARWRA